MRKVYITFRLGSIIDIMQVRFLFYSHRPPAAQVVRALVVMRKRGKKNYFAHYIDRTWENSEISGTKTACFV
jgi:hypothetical protein